LLREARPPPRTNAMPLTDLEGNGLWGEKNDRIHPQGGEKEVKKRRWPQKKRLKFGKGGDRENSPGGPTGVEKKDTSILGGEKKERKCKESWGRKLASLNEVHQGRKKRWGGEYPPQEGRGMTLEKILPRQGVALGSRNWGNI